MKYSFSTRGWDRCPWDELVEAAVEQDFAGIELHDPFAHEALTGKGAPFERYNVKATARSLKERGLCVPALDSPIDIAAGQEAVDAACALIELAAAASVPNAVVTVQTDDTAAVSAALEQLVPCAEQHGVNLLVETSGIFADTARLAQALDNHPSDNVGALWDVYSTCSAAQESPDSSIKALGAYVKHVHMRNADEDGSFHLVGEGALPLDRVVRALASIDYDGFISLEWDPAWMEDLQEMDVIFPHYVNFMEQLENQGRRPARRGLYVNHDGTGEYVWKKDELIDMTFPQVLDKMVETFPDQYCFKYTTLDYTRTYEEFRDDVDTFARALVSMGVKPGDKVAIWATNVPAWYITFWATTKIGAVLVTVNTAYKVHEAEYLLRQSDTHTLVMIESALDSNYAQIINELCPEIAHTKAGEQLRCKRLPFLRNVITVGFQMPGCLTFEQAFERASLVPQEKILRMAAEVKPDDVCNMQYTSGTTGFPKGVMLTHRNVVNDGKCIGDRMGLSTADRFMIHVPMFHCFGMTLSMTSSMTHGTTMCPMPYFSAKASLSCITQEKITAFNGVPTMFIAMFNHEDYRKTDFSHMRTGIMAGAGCPPELMKRAAQPDEMNMTGIVSVYGQTESAPGSTMSAWTDPLDLRTETVGYAFPHVECKIINPNTGEEMPDGAMGEFCSRGYNTMKGYYKMPQATFETVDEEGWLHSGDLLMRDERGCFVATGRIKDMIIRGGENVYPKEIEDFVITHEKVSDCQVIGVPDAKYGEEAMACIILMEGAELSEEEIRSYMQRNIARHKVPRYIKFVDSFPMNAAGKILKYKMREAAVEELGLQHLVKS